MFQDNEMKQVTVYNLDKMTLVTEAGFKDENFYACVLEAAGKDERIVLTDEELSSINTLDCTAKGITDVTGLEKLTGLTKLVLDENNYSGEIDFSNNKNLVELSLNKNKITKINLSGNLSLETLIVSANSTLTELDVSNNTNLKYLYASSCGLDNDELLLGNISGLKSLNLYQNNLSSIDLSNNKGLVDLNLSLNDLDEKDIDFKNFPILKRIYASGNIFKNVDLSNNPELTDANFYSNYDAKGEGLKSINVNGCSKLQYLLVSLNHLKELKLDTNIDLQHLYASGNEISGVDLSNNKKLYDIDLYSNKLSNIVLPETSSLEILKLSVNKLEALDVSSNVNLKKLYVSSNKLSELNLSKNTMLESANIAFNSFNSAVDFSNNNQLSYLWFDEELLTSYNFNKFVSLTRLGTVYSSEIMIYGDEFDLDNILNYVPGNIKLNNYSLYNTFNGFPDKYKIYDKIIDNPIEDIEDTIGASNNNNLSSVNIIKVGAGNSYKLQLLADNASNSKISNYDGSYSYNGFYTLRFIKITSNKYVINENNSTIDVGGDSDDKIIANLNSSYNGADITINGNSLKLSYNGEVIREFTLQRVAPVPTGSLTLYIILGILVICGVCVVIFRKSFRK